MPTKEILIIYDQPIYHPGEVITGQVVITLDKPKDVRGVELKIEGRTKFKWQYQSGDTTVVRAGKESYLKNHLKLEGEKKLTVGVHTYPFSVVLPQSIPSTFSGKYGGIAYYGKAKLVIPFGFDKTVMNSFQVENLLDLNLYPQLKNPAKQEKSKTFFSFSSANRALTVVAYMPKTGFAKTELIPITVKIDNPSSVNLENVNACLSRKIYWRAKNNTKKNKDKIKKIGFGSVSRNSSQTWSESVALDCGPFPNIRNCNIITVDYKLEIEAIPSGAHSELKLAIPITIGGIPFNDGESVAATE